MLNPFPFLLAFGLLAPLFLRVILGVTIIELAIKKSRRTNKRSILAYVEMLVGIMLIIGFYTQIAALVLSVLLVIELIKKIRSRAFLSDGINYYLILLVIALSLLFSGAGFFAFDLPL